MAERQYRTSQRYGKGTWLVNRARDVEFQVFDVVAGAKTPRDCSASSEEVHLRAWSDPTDEAADFFIDEELDKINGTASDPGGVTTTPGITGIVQGTATARAALAAGKMELVIIDTATVDATTRSGFVERVVEKPWDFDVSSAGPQG